MSGEMKGICCYCGCPSKQLQDVGWSHLELPLSCLYECKRKHDVTVDYAEDNFLSEVPVLPFDNLTSCSNCKETLVHSHLNTWQGVYVTPVVDTPDIGGLQKLKESN
jgi:hypothetical protein